MGASHVKPELSNQLLNSCWVASRADPDGELEPFQHLGKLIVEAGVDAAIINTALDVDQMFAQIDSLPPAQDGPRSAAVPAPVSYEETELELLKLGVTNPDLYNNLRKIFVDHKHPGRLDPMGQSLRKFFLNQKD